MKIMARGRNVEVTDALQEYVEKRVGKLSRFLDDVEKATVIMIVEGDSHKVEVTVPFNGMILRAEEATGDMYSSIDLVVDKLERRVEKYKGKFNRRRGGAGHKQFAGSPSAEEEDNGPKIVKTKRFAVKPMTEEEAMLQMNLLGHSFFVFSNAETEQVNVIYKRKDGNYGLIEPEF